MTAVAQDGGSGPLVAVIDYGIGNLRSAQKGLERAGAAAELTSDPDRIAEADAVVLPGVGNFGRCMEALESTGLASVAVDAAASGRPFLGICVGMQLLYEGSDEAPNRPGLGVLPGRVELLPDTVKRPQMQWNELTVRNEHPMVSGLDGAWMYFVHSYAAQVDETTVAQVEYGRQVAAAVALGTVWATQFHPEKSGASGLELLNNFVAQVSKPSLETVLS